MKTVFEKVFQLRKHKTTAKTEVMAGITTFMTMAYMLACLLYTSLAGGEMRQALSGYLNVLFEQNPKAVGGAMPGDDFYYAE